MSWGPQHQTTRRHPRRPLWVLVPGFALIGWWFLYPASEVVFFAVVIPGLLLLSAFERLATRGPAALKAKASEAIARSDDPHAAVRSDCRGTAVAPISESRTMGIGALPDRRVRCWCWDRRGLARPPG